ncbi:hypothetical protein JTM39_34960, partial [Pseudomonas aeruginosa]|nr:hypothetical protein [Pseudomonas aeruginosa]
VTNSPEIAAVLVKKPLYDVVILGGQVQRASGGCVGAAVLTFAGTCCSAPLVVTFTRLRAVRRKGVNEHGPVQMSGGEREIFFGLMKRQRNGREKFIAKGPAVPWTARRVVLVSAPANGLKRVIRVPGERSRHPPQRRNARARN